MHVGPLRRPIVPYRAAEECAREDLRGDHDKERDGGQSAEEAEQQKEEDEHQQGRHRDNDDGHHGRVGRK